MTVISRPIVNITKAPDSNTISNAPQKILVVGQQTGSTYTSGQLVESIGNDNTEIAAIGNGSHLGEMLRRIKQVNQVTRVDAIPLDDNGSAVDATGSIAFSGTATAAGTITINIGSRNDHSYDIAIAIGDTATEVGDALVTAIGADTYAIVTAVNTTGSVALTAKNGGTVGNQIGLESDGTVAGISVTVTAMSSGATDPVLTNLFDVVGDERYQTVIFPGSYDVTVVANTATSTTSFLDPRWNVTNNILDGVAVISKTDTLSNLKTFLNLRNSQSLIVNCDELVNDTYYKGSTVFELDDVKSAEIGAIRALRLTDGANLSGKVIANNLDLIGGTNKSSFPYFNTPLSFPVIDIGKGWSDVEIGELNDAGGFVVGNNRGKTSVILDNVVTTYKTDSASNTDVTYKYLNRVDQLSNIAEFLYNNLRADFPQFRLTDGDVIPGYSIANANTIISKFVEYYNTMSGGDYLLVRAGRANIQYFKDNLTVTLDLVNGKVTSTMKTQLVSQLRQFDVIVQAVLA